MSSPRSGRIAGGAASESGGERRVDTDIKRWLIPTSEPEPLEMNAAKVEESAELQRGKSDNGKPDEATRSGEYVITTDEKAEENK
ncbi:hypothetical protein N5P37_010523 [Trichoderma harzianum]|nr:hypothetical protein N5P37_010523 [Trichoderma harzianum]